MLMAVCKTNVETSGLGGWGVMKKNDTRREREQDVTWCQESLQML